MTLKEKIKRGEKIIGTHVNLTDIASAKIAGRSGYDFIWIDMEHSYLSFENLLGHIIAVKSGGTPVIVRAPQDELTFTKKILEMGVDGIIFPMVKTKEQADRLIESTLYAPHGNRGFGPINAIDFGIKSAKEYVDNSLDGICRFVQIEHIDTVNNLDEIMKNEFIDGYIFGPQDLAGSINRQCDITCKENVELIKNTTDKLHANDKFIGLSMGGVNNTELMKFWHDIGVDMLSVAADYEFLVDGMRTNREHLEKIHKGK